MNNSRNKLSVAVSNAVSTSKVNLPSTKKGRPALQGYDKLYAQAFNDFKEFDKLSNELKDKVNISSFSSIKDQNLLRSNLKERRNKGTSVAILLNKIKHCKNTKFKMQLTESKNNLLKQLDEIPLEGQLELEEKALNSVGKPAYPFIVYYSRAELTSDNSKMKLNNNERKNGRSITSISDFRRRINENKNNPKIGRKPNTEIDNYDVELKKIKNRIFQIEGNIADKTQNGIKAKGRKRHAEQQLDKQSRIYKYVHQKILKLEEKMSEYELSQRRIQKLKDDRQGLRRKVHDANLMEKRFLNRQIFELTMKIKEEEYSSKQLCNSQEQNKTPEVHEVTAVREDINVISIDDLLLELNLEKTKINERNLYLTELIEKITAKKKAA